MKAKSWAVVVQWGGGFIYFLKTYDSLEEANVEALRHAAYLYNKKRKGAKPTVSVWLRQHSFEQKT